MYEGIHSALIRSLRIFVDILIVFIFFIFFNIKYEHFIKLVEI